MRLTSLMIPAFVILLGISSGCSERQFGEPDEMPRHVSRIEMQSVLEYLASDLLEGRAPGTRGGELAEEYVRSLLKSYDIPPYGGDYFQEFTLSGFTTTELTVEANGVSLAFRDEAVGSFTGTGSAVDLTGPAVFVGFGIKSSEYVHGFLQGSGTSAPAVIMRMFFGKCTHRTRQIGVFTEIVIDPLEAKLEIFCFFLHFCQGKITADFNLR